MSDTIGITQQQFDAAARNTKLADQSRRAASMVLVQGLSHPKAAKLVGIKHRQQVSRAVNCVRRVLTEGGSCPVCGAQTHVGS